MWIENTLDDYIEMLKLITTDKKLIFRLSRWNYLFFFLFMCIKLTKLNNVRGKILRKKTLNNRNEFKMNKELSEKEKKQLFNKKLLKVIISTEKNIYGRCNSW